MQDKLIEAEIDDGILGVVLVLNDAGVKTFSSCQGGGYECGHGYLRPIVCFDGDDSEGERAEKIATDAGYQVFQVQRVWYTRDGERVGPFWEMEFVAGAACRAPKDRAAVRAHDAPEMQPWWEKEWAESFKKYREYAAQHGCPLGGDLLEFVLQDALAYRASHATESAPVAQPMEEALTSSAEELGYPCQQPAAEPGEDAVERIVCHACGMAMVCRRVDTKTLETFHTCAEARKGYVKLEDVEKAIREMWTYVKNGSCLSVDSFVNAFRASLAPKLEPTLAEVRSILAKRGLIEYFQLAAELAALVDRRPK